VGWFCRSARAPLPPTDLTRTCARHDQHKLADQHTVTITYTTKRAATSTRKPPVGAGMATGHLAAQRIGYTARAATTGHSRHPSTPPSHPATAVRHSAHGAWSFRLAEQGNAGPAERAARGVRGPEESQVGPSWAYLRQCGRIAETVTGGRKKATWPEPTGRLGPCFGRTKPRAA
jgi:hypothetical protein